MIGAYVLLNCKKGNEKKITELLKQIKEVKEAQCIDGPYNLIIKLESESKEKLHRVITWKIRKLEDVKATFTLRYDEESDACEDF
ncbi:AsnC family transcriptional regulator [Nitrosopumilus sp. b1]|nr:AsnC family transcriptional regulator [Nitrosopumilus sp. b1]